MSRRSPQREDPLTYRIAYSRIAQELHAWTATEVDSAHREGLEIPAASLREALILVQREVPVPERPDLVAPGSEQGFQVKGGPAQRARELVELSREELLRLGNRWVGETRSKFGRIRTLRWKAADSRLGTFLASIVEPASVAIYFSVRVQEGWVPDFDLDLSEVKRVDRRRVHRVDEVPDLWFYEYLERIRATDAALSYRARYNLACLFSRAAWQLREHETRSMTYRAEAIHQLGLSFAAVSGPRRAAIQAWAWRDPAFIGLKELAWHDFSRTAGPAPPHDH